MKQFRISDIFKTTCPYTGGIHAYQVISRTETEINCEAVYVELDGTHKTTETFKVHTDEEGNEYIISWRIGEHKGIVYAEEV
jgi:hypothetical protein